MSQTKVSVFGTLFIYWLIVNQHRRARNICDTVGSEKLCQQGS